MVSVYLWAEIGALCYLADSVLPSVPGSSIGTLSATDNDQKDTLNSRLKFKILSQDPAVPTSNLFFIQQDTGVLQLYGHSLNKRIASNYSLKVQVTDEGM